MVLYFVRAIAITLNLLFISCIFQSYQEALKRLKPNFDEMNFLQGPE
jgi:DNA replication protein DnaC